MMNYTEAKQIALEALEKLNTVNKINLSFHVFIEDIYNNGFFHLQTITSKGCFIETNFFGDEIDMPRQPNESQSISFHDIQLLRVAKKIFDDYKNGVNNSNTISLNASYTGSAQTIFANDIYAPNISTMDTRIDDLEREKQMLKDEIENLKRQLLDKSAMLDALWYTLHDKGVL